MPHVDPHALEPLVEMLVETGDPGARDRLLLDAPALLGVPAAVALWRRVDARDGSPPAWREVLARGPRELLPQAARVAAVADGREPTDLAGTATVLVAGTAERRRALCLGGLLDEHEPAVDLLEALLCTHAALEEAWQPAADPLLDRLAPALPSPARGGAASTGPEARLRHDVRNHLASIRSTRELLERFGPRLTPVERDHFHAVLEREVRRASDLLVRTVRHDAAHPGTSSPPTVVRDVVDSERAACEAHGIELELLADPRADGVRIGLAEVDVDRILRNLLVNARQALVGREAPMIRVRLEPRGGLLVLEVTDNGPGIDAGLVGRVWDEGATHGKHGSGLGLAVVRELVLATGGTVEAGSAPPGGARFTVAFPPLAVPAAESQKNPPGTSLPVRGD